MSAVESLRLLTGTWAGTSRLLLPGEPTREVPSTATIALAARGKFNAITYAWSYQGEAQEGLLLLGHEHDGVNAVWIDSWHMGDKFMSLQGKPGTTDALVLRGSYTVEASPDWGWRIDLEPAYASLRITMYNVSPDGEEELGVEALYDQAT